MKAYISLERGRYAFLHVLCHEDIDTLLKEQQMNTGGKDYGMFFSISS